jgi:hypothetical protein
LRTDTPGVSVRNLMINPVCWNRPNGPISGLSGRPLASP